MDVHELLRVPTITDSPFPARTAAGLPRVVHCEEGLDPTPDPGGDAAPWRFLSVCSVCGAAEEYNPSDGFRGFCEHTAMPGPLGTRPWAPEDPALVQRWQEIRAVLEDHWILTKKD